MPVIVKGEWGRWVVGRDSKWIRARTYSEKKERHRAGWTPFCGVTEREIVRTNGGVGARHKSWGRAQNTVGKSNRQNSRGNGFQEGRREKS